MMRYDLQSEEALNPTTDTRDALTHTFAGRRLTVD